MLTEHAQGREFIFSDGHFERLRKSVREHTGIHLSDAKRELVYGRLSRRIRKLGLSGFDDYCGLVDGEEETELTEFMNAITTNLTSFFRENHHFEFLLQTAIPELAKLSGAKKRVRIWSAGCSTGEEPYSIAMTVLEAIGNTAGWDIKILATDLDSNVLAKAAQGVYPIERVESVARARLGRWFNKGRGNKAGLVRVCDDVKSLIKFKQLNLMHPWPFHGGFDIIFCRNVVIYFDKDTQRKLFDRYANVLPEHGLLFVGHSETLFKVSDRFKLLGKTIYRKTV